jgi:hypothetical protein
MAKANMHDNAERSNLVYNILEYIKKNYAPPNAKPIQEKKLELEGIFDVFNNPKKFCTEASSFLEKAGVKNINTLLVCLEDIPVFHDHLLDMMKFEGSITFLSRFIDPIIRENLDILLKEQQLDIVISELCKYTKLLSSIEYVGKYVVNERDEVISRTFFLTALKNIPPIIKSNFELLSKYTQLDYGIVVAYNSKILSVLDSHHIEAVNSIVKSNFELLLRHNQLESFIKAFTESNEILDKVKFFVEDARQVREDLSKIYHRYQLDKYLTSQLNAFLAPLPLDGIISAYCMEDDQCNSTPYPIEGPMVLTSLIKSLKNPNLEKFQVSNYLEQILKEEMLKLKGPALPLPGLPLVSEWLLGLEAAGNVNEVLHSTALLGEDEEKSPGGMESTEYNPYYTML